MRYRDDEVSALTESSALRAFIALTHAGERLASARDAEEAMRIALTTLVPHFGDGCVIELFEPDQSRCSAAAHVDPDVEDGLRARLRSHSLLDAHFAVQRDEAVQTRRPVVANESTASLLTGAPNGRTSSTLENSVATAASIVAPLVARDRVLGALALFRDTAGHPYGETEILLATELSRQVAMAADSAQLAATTERAQHESVERRTVPDTGAAYDRRRMESLLQRSERALASLVEHSPDFIVRFDDALRYRYVSPSITRITGIPAEEYIGRRMDELHMPADLVALWETHLRRTLESGGPLHFMHLYAPSGGEAREYDTLLVAEEDEISGARTVLGFSRDVSELRRARNRLQETLDRVTDAVVLFDTSLRIMDLNRVAAQAIGMEPSDAIGLTVAEVFETPIGVSDEVLTATLLENAPQTAELPHPADGRWFSVQTYPSEHGIALFARDVTDRRRAEAQERDARAELEHRVEERTRELADANARLAAASRQKSEFLTSVSHELRTPLNAVIGFSVMVHDEKAGPISAEQRELLDDVLGAANQLRALIDDLLDTARVEAGAMRIEPAPLSIVELLEEVRDTLRGLAAERRLQLEIGEESESIDVVIDRQRLRQVLLNFASNAIKFTRVGGSVTLRARRDTPGWFRVEVEDTGIGIAAEDQANLFKAFVQVSGPGFSHDGASGGTGLGLALSRRITELMGGRVGVESARDSGSRFYALLPLMPSSQEEDA